MLLLGDDHDAKGKECRNDSYEEMSTPDEKLKSLSYCQSVSQTRITIEQLNAQAACMSDNDAATHPRCLSPRARAPTTLRGSEQRIQRPAAPLGGLRLALF
jgi:hypothetical protein